MLLADIKQNNATMPVYPKIMASSFSFKQFKVNQEKYIVAKLKLNGLQQEMFHKRYKSKMSLFVKC